MEKALKIHAGTSLPRAARRRLAAVATVAPPVKAGDITRDVEEGVACVVILDGVFGGGITAGPGEILVSSSVRDLVAGSGFTFTDRGMHALKGVEEDRRLYAVA